MRGRSGVSIRSGVSRCLLAGAAVAALAMSGTARAEENAGPESQAAVGVGMICDTPQQAERFVELRASGTAPQQAMEAVNNEARDEHACGVAAIAFTRAATVDNKPVENKLVQVVRINVLAGFDGNGWQPVSNMTQYAIMEGEGETI